MNMLTSMYICMIKIIYKKNVFSQKITQNKKET